MPAGLIFVKEIVFLKPPSNNPAEKSRPWHTVVVNPESVSMKIPYHNTVRDGRKITQNVLGEHKVITTEQQFLGVILSFFMHLRWPWLSRFFA